MSKNVDEHVQIVLFTVADAAAQDKLIAGVGEEIEAWVGAQPGFVSATFHRSPDGRRVANYAVWRRRSDWEAFAQHPNQRRIRAAIEAASAVSDRAGGGFVIARLFDAASSKSQPAQSTEQPFVDPAAQRVLDRIAAQAAAAPPTCHDITEAERVAGIRQGYAGAAALSGTPEPVAHVRDLMVDPTGSAVPVRLYDPRQAPVPGAPALVWLHGGSFIAGDLETHDVPLRAMANRIGFPVIAVAWRLAPDHPYPAGLNDAVTVLAWLASGGGPDPDPARLFVGGDSAGGAIAAVLAQRARDGGPGIAGEVLIYPNTDLSGDFDAYPSWVSNNGRILERTEMDRNFALYAASADRTDPGLSPVRADRLDGLPPTLLVTGEADPQRDEAELYGRKLASAGVAVEAVRVCGMIHGFMQMAGVLPAGAALIDGIGAWLRRRVAAIGPGDL